MYIHIQAKTVLAETVETKLKDLDGAKIQFTGINTFKGGKVVWVKVFHLKCKFDISNQ